MTVRPGSPTVLIVDQDVGFVWWLGEIFNDAGYQTVPALHCREALALYKKLDLPVSILIVNPELRGAPRMIETLGRAKHPGIVLIENYRPARKLRIHAHATIERPDGWEPVSRLEWLRKVRRVLKNLGSRAAS